VNCPEVTTFAIPDPEIVPIKADEALISAGILIMTFLPKIKVSSQPQ
jgi:hypothetical protein